MTAHRSNARGRYLKRFTVSMIAYAVLLIGSVLTLENIEGSQLANGPWRYALALAPSLPILATIWSMGAYLADEADEFRRTILAQSMLWALGLTLSFTSVWGFMEEFAQVPRFPLYLTFPVFCFAMALAQVFVTRRYK
ncbi:MAG: hypothetical protein A4S17_13795 [Proteobacteria bacterium HN_bin10]|jgi:hypothetical protein|nr:MAG: hypothetical protein A4S17_13795 [Proteobacteria bacterium HN_bin10]